MFTRDSKPPRIDTLIGKTSRVQGDVEFEGGMHLDGEVCGAVRADPAQESSLSVSESGAVLGAVQVRNLILDGTVKGDIHAPGRLVLGATARVEACSESPSKRTHPPKSPAAMAARPPKASPMFNRSIGSSL